MHVGMSMMERLVELFASALVTDSSIDKALDEFLSATESRAVGLWRVVADELHCVGFRAHATMPVEVSDSFAAATRVVALSETGLGIVKAALCHQPALALLATKGGMLSGSASWLERFAAQQSLAVPLLRDEKPKGVLALSTPYTFGPDHPAWQLTTDLAPRLSLYL